MRSSYGTSPKVRKLKLARVGSRNSGASGIGSAQTYPGLMAQQALLAYKQLCVLNLERGQANFMWQQVQTELKVQNHTRLPAPEWGEGAGEGHGGMPTSFSKKPETSESPLALIPQVRTVLQEGWWEPWKLQPSILGQAHRPPCSEADSAAGGPRDPRWPPWPCPV